MFIAQDALSIGCGALVGFTLGLIGGGGSVLAVPLLVYVVGTASPHIAIGTSAVAVATSALTNLVGHARSHTVKWRCAAVFAVVGVLGAALGAALGKMVDGQKLLALFGALMIVVALAMLRRRKDGGDPDVRLATDSARQLLPALVGTALVVGGLSGFFGIGGGFLIVPGLVDWRIAGFFILGGIAGGIVGIWLSQRLAARKRALSLVFASVVMMVGVYVVIRGVLALV